MIPKFVICGVEHSGTTLVSDVFRQVEGIDSGFEVGVLLSKSPKEFRLLEPFISNMKEGWGLNEKQLDKLCDCDEIEEFYLRLKKTGAIVNQNNDIFDKTPRYFSVLESCLKKVPCNFIATYKDPRSIVYSDYKRANDISFEEWFEIYAPKKLQYLTTIYKQYQACKKWDGERVTMVGLEDIALNTRYIFEKMFSVLNIDFKIEYLMLKNMRYKNTKAAYVSSKIPFEYMGEFSAAQEKLIVEWFSVLDEWFYD